MMEITSPTTIKKGIKRTHISGIHFGQAVLINDLDYCFDFICMVIPQFGQLNAISDIIFVM